MEEIALNEKISYLPGIEEPLSADIGIIRNEGKTWLYDVGFGKAEKLDADCIVISHFHKDHTGDLDKYADAEIYLSKESYRHFKRGIVVDKDLWIGGLHLFSLASSHAKGCLGLEFGDYAFMGDGLYGRYKDGCLVYNTQLLNEKLKVLKKLQAQYLLVSHFPCLVRKKEEVIAELEAVYERRLKDSFEIRIER